MTIRLGLAAGLLAIAAPFPALAETRGSVDVAANVGFSNNPFSVIGDDSSSGYGELSLTPTLRLIQPRSTVTLSGGASLQQYFRRYGTNENYQASVDYSGTPTERLTTHARVDYIDSVIGSYNGFDSDGVLDPGGTLLPPVNDVALFGTRDRRRNLRGSVDAAYAVTARDRVSASAFVDGARYSRFGGLGDYNGYGGTLGYDRQVSQTARVGILGSASAFDYDARGTTRIYSVEGTLSLDISEVWSGSGRVGVSFVEGDAAGSTRSTSLSGEVNLCRRGARSNFCVDASRQVRPTGFNGTQYVTAIAANWNYKLSERSGLNASADYSRENGARSLLLPGLQARYVRASAGYERRVTERLRLTADVQYRDVSGRSFNRAADYGGRIGLAYRIGDLQ